MNKKVLVLMLCALFSICSNAQNTIRNVTLDCYMETPGAKIYTEPDLNSVEEDISEGLGTSWGFEVDSEVTTPNGVFFSGTLVNPRGNTIDGIFYIQKSEWRCGVTSFADPKENTAKQVTKPVVKLTPPKAYTVTAYKMYTCDSKQLDINNLDYTSCPSKTRIYTISVKPTSITITDTKIKSDFEYDYLTYNKVKGYDHYVDPRRQNLCEFYIDRTKKILISRSIIDNGFRDVYTVYLLK